MKKEEIDQIKKEMTRVGYRMDSLKFRLESIYRSLSDEEKALYGEDVSAMITKLDLVNVIKVNGERL